LTNWQRSFQEAVGGRHAQYFDQRGWLYFTRESYDLFYPSYGDTWPGFQGAAGFTYEQWGSGPASVASLRPNGDTVTLAFRIDRHTVTGLSTVETAVDQALKLRQELQQYYQRARKGRKTRYQSYLIRPTANPARVAALCTLLDRNQIQYGYVDQNLSRSLSGYSYRQGVTQTVSPRKGDLVVPVAQTQGHLVQALFEPEPKLSDSLTYDLTAWAIPFAYNLEAWALPNTVNYTSQTPDKQAPALADSLPYAYLLRWGDVAQARFVSQALQAKLVLRYATEAFEVGGVSYAPGTILLARSDQQAGAARRLQKLLNNTPVQLVPVQTGKVRSGRDLGSSSYRLIRLGRIAMLWGPGMSETALGAVWHTLEEVLGYPVELIGTDYLSNIDLSDYQMLILPNGRYSRWDSELLTYARQGGRILAMERALSLFTQAREGQDATALAKAVQKRRRTPGIKPPERGTGQRRYGDRVRDGMRKAMPGAIYQVNLDTTHPLAFGVASPYALLKQNRTVYPALDTGWNVGTITSTKPVSGFSGSALDGVFKGSLAFGTENYGRGELIYFAESPVFRGFWHSGMLLFANALFFH
ncbi:MAG: M14 family metallopeptidase, partial [Bacteroidota bacterium]